MALSAGVDPSTIRQLLLQHTFLPLISVQLSHNADRLFQQACQNSLTLVLQAFRPYGNNAKHGSPNQTYKITNTQLISRTYGLFPVRFEPLLPELLTVHNPPDGKLTGLFSISSLELILKKLSTQQTAHSDPDSDLYMNMFRRVITSNKVVLFDTLNHPVSQLFVIDYENDSIESLRKMIVEFRNFTFPKYFQVSDLLVHVFILYNPSTASEADVAQLQNEIRNHLTVTSSALPISDVSGADQQFVRMSKFDNATIDGEVQKISLQQGKDSDDDDYIQIPLDLDVTLRGKIYEFISKQLIPHMERKIRTWDDLVLSPKKSITGRFFSVSRKLFNNNSSEQLSQNSSSESYNSVHNYYYRSSPEQIIRKLADWSLMLKDFKYAYSTYDLIKKDYTNDKAWVYVATTQEMCIVSLLLAQTQPIASDTLPQAPDKNTLRKIRHDIIEPYIDNLSYTFKSRFNVKTYAIKSYLVVAELLLNMSDMFNIPWWWSDLIERYLLICANEVDMHLASIGDGPQAIRAIIYERLGYATGKFSYVPREYHDLIETAFTTEEEPEADNEDDGTYKNTFKIQPDKDNAIKGLTRLRKRSLWYILSMREWLKLENIHQVRYLVDNLALQYKMDGTSNKWYDRPDLVLATIVASLNEE